MDLDTPEGRLAAAEALGPDGYNRALQNHFGKNTVKIVNGYALRWVSSRWGRICMVEGDGGGFSTLEAAEARANSLPKKD